MNRFFRYLVGPGIALLLFLLCSCGSSGSSGGDIGNQDTSKSGPVRIDTDKKTYASTDSIKVSVTNNTKNSLFSYDTRASCTILGLQIQMNSTWQDTQIARCSLGRPAMPVEIAARSVYTAVISAGAQGASQATFPPGTYRLLLTYSTSRVPLSQQNSQNTTTIYSATITVIGSH